MRLRRYWRFYCVQNSISINARTSAKQHADLTFKHNINQARHGWLRLTPAFSVKVVEGILGNKKGNLNVFDPFSGTATTPLCAAYHGHHAISIDINPFLVWLGETKLRHYKQEALREAKEKAILIQSSVDNRRTRKCQPPPIAHIDRWWDKKHLDYLCSLKGGIDQISYLHPESRDLLLVAFCRFVIDLSNAAFNHQSMSFKHKEIGARQSKLWQDDKLDHQPFPSHVNTIVEAASHNPNGVGHALLYDARELDGIPGAGFDMLITSPPYPNRMSYIRELRPYMYWLGYLQEAREAGELDWRAIGGTWGIATSRLNEWKRDNTTFFPEYLENILQHIARSGGKSGELLSKYVGKYFEDMWRHFIAVRSVMNNGGELHYIIGNSKFYEFLVPAEMIFSDMLKKAGFHDIDITILRKRNSKKELFEFDVVATK